MNSVAILLKLIDGYKTYASVIMAVASGLGMILSKDYSNGLTQIFQALLVVSGGASVASMRHAVSKVEAPAQPAPVSQP
jgi:hypothetical protein